MVHKWRKTLENIWYHYKYHLMIGLGLFVFLVSLSSTIVKGQLQNKADNQSDEQLEILLFGDYKVGIEQEILEENILLYFPDQKIRVTTEFAPPEPNSMDDIASQQKSTTTLLTARPDIYIFDTVQFHKLIDDGPFLKLDAFFHHAEAGLVYGQTSQDQQRHIYGVQFTNSHLFAGMEIADKQKIAVIRADSNHIENAVQLIKRGIEAEELHQSNR